MPEVEIRRGFRVTPLKENIDIIDEISADNVDLHIERMDFDYYFMTVYHRKTDTAYQFELVVDNDYGKCELTLTPQDKTRSSWYAEVKQGWKKFCHKHGIRISAPNRRRLQKMENENANLLNKKI